MPKTITRQIKDAAFDLLKAHPEGLRYSELAEKILERDAHFNPNTIQGSIWDLDAKFPTKVYKPSRGLFRLLEYKAAEEPTEVQLPSTPTEITETTFYQPFADYLKNDLEDVTQVITLGGNIFREKWGTPDVVGKHELRRSDIIKGETEIVSAEIKLDTAQLVTAFGQACSYRLFSQRPRPDCFVPPNGAAGSETRPRFNPIMP